MPEIKLSKYDRHRLLKMLERMKQQTKLFEEHLQRLSILCSNCGIGTTSHFSKDANADVCDECGSQW